MKPDKISWEDIRALYEKARENLWNLKHCKSWKRDEETGWYYLWSAYHFANISDAKQVDHRTYARILGMLASELHYKIYDDERYQKFPLPALKEYEKAIACGQEVEDKEYNRVKEECDAEEYQADREMNPEKNWKEFISLIENGELINEKGFEFHDSKPVYFQHTDTEAILKLSNYDLLAVFRFQGLYSIEIDTDPVSNWVIDFYCYRIKETGKLKFSAGDYYIICDRIILDELSSKRQK